MRLHNCFVRISTKSGRKPQSDLHVCVYMSYSLIKKAESQMRSNEIFQMEIPPAFKVSFTTDNSCTKQSLWCILLLLLSHPDRKKNKSRSFRVNLFANFCSYVRTWSNLLPAPNGKGCLQILGEPKENRKLAAEIVLQNPLPEPLENCCFSIEGANLTGGRIISERLDTNSPFSSQHRISIVSWNHHCHLNIYVVAEGPDSVCH